MKKFRVCKDFVAGGRAFTVGEEFSGEWLRGSGACGHYFWDVEVGGTVYTMPYGSVEEQNFFHCDRCGQDKSFFSSFTTGYGVYGGEKHCYECCAEVDRQRMVADGRIALYLSGGEVKNWPGSLSFRVTGQSKGHHNIARTRTDVWFVGPDGGKWHGVLYGENTQICHCRRLKGTATLVSR